MLVRDEKFMQKISDFIMVEIEVISCMHYALSSNYDHSIDKRFGIKSLEPVGIFESIKVKER